ncbi:hypothetical protein CS006_10460 [Bifidobacterium primatium]|uniref:Uncharacterized protein n=2 Tax=Bifidobacterium TaxID=1678 RepID=A0A2M9H6A9_9BIFI|nr:MULTISPECIES: hypothetical protein [Bifidobacterium]NEG95998.1 hypothetical protein [Bifidobacterium sp. SMB2]NEH12463.1 hypothetical protein [Bifidobacterium saimiriisciurei]PJM72349.1 hypothetical protein CS006_10460 [Bifidobacterium primatium]
MSDIDSGELLDWLQEMKHQHEKSADWATGKGLPLMATCSVGSLLTLEQVIHHVRESAGSQ